MTAHCERCGADYGVGEWPWCPHGPMGHGMLGEFHPYVDHAVGPAVGGEHISSLADRWRLMRQNRLDYRGRKVGDPRCEV